MQQQGEVDFFQVLSRLWQQKLLILIVISIFLGIGILHVKSIQNVYQAKSILVKPSLGAISSLNAVTLISKTQEQVFKDYIQLIESPEIRASYIRDNAGTVKELLGGAKGSEGQYILGSLLKLHFYSDDETGKEVYSLVLEGDDPSVLTKNLDSFLSYVQRQLIRQYQSVFSLRKQITISQIKQNEKLLTLKLDLHKESKLAKLDEEWTLATRQFEDQLKARKLYILNTRLDSIKRLQEAITIASKLDIIEPTSLDSLEKKTERNIEISADISQGRGNEPLYLRGVKLLTAELNTLVARPKNLYLDDQIRIIEQKLEESKVNREIELVKQRESNLAFSEALQELRLELLKVDSQMFPELSEFGVQDGDAYFNPIPVNSKRKLFVLWVVCGFIFSLLVAFLRSSFLVKDKDF